MATTLSLAHELAVDIEERRVHAVEHALFHPVRRSLVSLTGHSLQELDPQHGATIGEAAFDLPLLLSDRPAPGGAAARLLEHVVPVGAHHVAAIFQARSLVIWDLRDAVLVAATEVEKAPKSVAALAGSLCKDKWLFYASEGSNSIKVTAVESREPPKKIARKAANRSQLSALAYDSTRRVLAAGASDGALQLWLFSEENAPLAGSTKEEAAMVTPLFAAQTTSAPVVRLAFARSGPHAQHLLLVAYQNRVVEVWDLAPTGHARQREPVRVAILHCLPPQAADFAKKNGEVVFHLDPLAPLLLVHWHSFHGAGSCVAATELRLGPGSAATAPPPVTLSEWHELVPAAAPSHEDGSAVVVFGGSGASSLTAYVSSHHQRQLLPLSAASQQLDAIREDAMMLALSTSFQLSVDQYFKYQDVPTTLLQIARSAEDGSSSPTQQTIPFQLQRYSQLTGEVEKLDELPVWNNYQGRQLLPWALRWNDQQSALCVQLRDPTKGLTSDHDAGLTYVMLEIKAKTKSATLDTEADSDTNASVSVTCGSPMDALDVCFCGLRSDEAQQTRAYVLLVLASTGKSIGFQTTCDHVDQNARVLLNQPVRRIFATPIALSASSPHASLVGCRLLYVLAPGGRADTSNAPQDTQTLVLSDDDLAVPRSTASRFQTRANGERIVDVAWNSGVSQPADSSAGPLLVAVRTTQRVVVLSVAALPLTLSLVAEYDLERDLGSPTSLLWIAQSLLFVTSDQHVRFVTPLVPTTTPPPAAITSQLLCSLASDFATPLHVQLLSACSDRLCYAVVDPRSLECRTFMRPLAVCEPLLLGVAEPRDARLKAIFERDFLVFLATGGAETRTPVSERLLNVLYHDFGWHDTVAKVLDALLHPSTAAGVSASGGGGGGASGSATGAAYKKLAHLPAALVSSLLFHAHKWKDGVRVQLANDPALEEYALADDDGVGGSGSSAKLPSRTGATSSRFQWLAAVLASVGQPELALKCLDLAGDDLAIVDLLHKHGLDPAASESLLAALQKDWRQLNPPLAAITRTPDSARAPRRQDMFALLCCDQLGQTERRSRLLASVRPLDKLIMKATPKEDTAKPPLPGACGRAGILYWKRLAPEDAKDVLGTSPSPHFSADEPKNPASYALFHGGAGGGSALTIGVSEEPNSAAGGDTATGSNEAKMTIGPFLEDEDAVVAYWRFEEGATADDGGGPTAPPRTLDSMDTTKRENHLQILQFGGSGMALATSSAPVDKGEESKLQEAFALRFPLAETAASLPLDDEWGAKCAVRPGSTLDIGFVFDEDPYRRKLTFEAWVRNVALFRKKQQAEDDGQAGDGDEPSGTGPSDAWRDDPTATRRLVSRRGADKTTWWEFGLCDGGALFLTFAGHTLKAADDKIANAAAWQHVAFSIDISSPKLATLRLYLQARCVASKEIANVDTNAKLLAAAMRALPPADSATAVPPPPSTLHLGLALTDYEMTEVRVWATARTAEQLGDMKENYLGIAEAKRRMKIAIHQRNCQCEKCLGRRTAKPAAGKAGAPLLGAPLFPSTPPPAGGSVRDRRRPQPKSTT